jgi:hypothetical protein
MIGATDCCCATPLLPFLKTLIDIALLQKGPEHIPRSVILLVLAIFMWSVAALSAMLLIDHFDEGDFTLEIFSVLIAVASYSAVVLGARQGARLTQTMTAILGCGALMTMIIVACYALLLPLVGPPLMTILVWVILLWSLSIKGHIIAHTIERHWYLGLAIAVSVFILQSVAIKLVFPEG